MHVATGQLISLAALKALPPDEAASYVEVSGTPEHVARVSRAVAHYGAITSRDKSRRRAANKAARKARRANRT